MYTFSKQLWGLHSPSTCSVQNFQIFTGDHFFHTYTLHTCFRVNSPYSYLVFTLQAHVRFKIFNFSREIIFFMLTLSTHVSGFTLHTVIWFTLSKHMFGSKFSNFQRSSFFSYLHSPHMFQDSLSIQLFGLRSPSTCYVQIFSGDHFFVLTLSTHVSEFTLHAVVFTLSKQMLNYSRL